MLYHNGLTGRYSKLQEQYNEAFTSIQDQKQLIGQLEEDLRSVNAWSTMFRGTAEVSLQISYHIWDLYCPPHYVTKDMGT